MVSPLILKSPQPTSLRLSQLGLDLSSESSVHTVVAGGRGHALRKESGLTNVAF